MNQNAQKVDAAAAAARITGKTKEKSGEASRMVRNLLDAPVPVRRDVIRSFTPDELTFLLLQAQEEAGSLYYFWHDSPSGFVEDVVGETMWSKQIEVLDAIATHKRVIVPAGFGVGKCVYEHDMIPLASGELVRAGDLVGTEFEVVAFVEDDWKARPVRKARAEWNATEPIYEVRSLRGTVRRNAHHPLYVLDRTGIRRGWTPVSQIRPGEYVLGPQGTSCAWFEVLEVSVMPDPGRTVAIEVDGEHTFFTSLAEHNTHLAGRATAWFVCTQPPGIAQVVTTATRLRQVRNQLWPHIRKVHGKAGLPGHTDTMQWKIPDEYGTDVLAAYGFSAPDNDEAAMQGIHAIKLLLIVDEAGGISKMVGEGTNNLLTGDARMLAIGNPAMDDPGSWFEKIAMEGYSGEEPGTTTIKIATFHSPQITGEKTPMCTECPKAAGVHPLSNHLPDKDWMDRTVRAYGEDHPYVIAKVNADFPKEAGLRIIPTTWVENSMKSEDPTGDAFVRLCDLDLEGETDTFTVKKGAWVRLGVDVAADGGDELAIYRAVGDTVSQRHVSSGAVNNNSVVVAERILAHIKAAEALARKLGSQAQVRVKVDTIGVGWGVYGILKRWGEPGPGQQHTAAIVKADVREKPEAEDEGAEMRPYRKRDELWLTGRWLLQPDPKTGESRLRLRVDEKCGQQLAIPNYSNQAGGFVVVESKASMKKRGRSSPDRAEGCLLAIYEPFPVKQRRNRGIITGG